MFKNYLNGLQFERCDASDPKLRDVYVITASNGAYYYFATYKNFEAKKTYFFTLLNNYQTEVKGAWEFHHIVEKQHLQNFYLDSKLEHLYNYEWPCILIHKGQHSVYSGLFKIKETKLLFDINKNVDKATLLKNVMTMYQEVYRGNRMLSTIAQNVLRGVPIS